MTSYNLDAILRIAKPGNRIRRQTWSANNYITIPDSNFIPLYKTNYSAAPTIVIMNFTIDDITGNDWVNLDG